jgi:hypothetical protein
MLFTFSITAPANTPKSDPVRQTLKLKAGWITKVEVLIPNGHEALAHLAIYDGETMIMPWGEDQYIEGNDEIITWEPDYLLPSEPATLEVRAWNEDEEYQHTFYIRIWVESEPVKLSTVQLNRTYTLLESFLRRVLGE